MHRKTPRLPRHLWVMKTSARRHRSCRIKQLFHQESLASESRRCNPPSAFGRAAFQTGQIHPPGPLRISFLNSPFFSSGKEPVSPCLKETKASIPKNKSAKPSTSKQATKRAEPRKKKRNAALGRPLISRTAAARKQVAPVAKPRPTRNNLPLRGKQGLYSSSSSSSIIPAGLPGGGRMPG